MFQLRIYTLRSPAALQQYAAIHWARHLVTSPQFAADMAGFNPDEIVDVQSVPLDPTAFSPLH
jgi:hypothetical protein